MVFNLKKFSQYVSQPIAPEPTAADSFATDSFADLEKSEELDNIQNQVEQTGEYTQEQEQIRIDTGDFESYPFIDEGDLTDYLNLAGEEKAQQQLIELAKGTDNANSLGSFIQGFYLEKPENRLKYAMSNIWPMLDNSAKRIRPENGVDDFTGDQETMQTPVKTTDKVEVVMPTVAESNKEIKKLAQEHSKQAKQSKGFNLKKYAQHKTVQELVLHGPDSKRISPFTGELESDWHVIERNKSWGYRVGDLWNLDFEQFWRQNIMDKYSRPYRDKDGNWVGGYLQKRFEVDKFIPEENNLQYKPGQYRKPYIPEQRSLEARMEAMRAKQDRGYAPDSDGKPYDWNKKPEYAQTKIAQVQNDWRSNSRINLETQMEEVLGSILQKTYRKFPEDEAAAVYTAVQEVLEIHPEWNKEELKSLAWSMIPDPGIGKEFSLNSKIKTASKGFNLKQYKGAQSEYDFAEEANPEMLGQEQQIIGADDSDWQDVDKSMEPLVVDEWRFQKVIELAQAEGRLPEEMLKIVLDRGLDFFRGSNPDFAARMASANQKKK